MNLLTRIKRLAAGSSAREHVFEITPRGISWALLADPAVAELREPLEPGVVEVSPLRTNVADPAGFRQGGGPAGSRGRGQAGEAPARRAAAARLRRAHRRARLRHVSVRPRRAGGAGAFQGEESRAVRHRLGRGRLPCAPAAGGRRHRRHHRGAEHGCRRALRGAVRGCRGFPVRFRRRLGAVGVVARRRGRAEQRRSGDGGQAR
ncbi:MAG: hypothetical protein MZV70_19335 [Desulfobacterales bacterium]|nr:hypothetical protein [Desulfobacterales bacterium]